MINRASYRSKLKSIEVNVAQAGSSSRVVLNADTMLDAVLEYLHLYLTVSLPVLLALLIYKDPRHLCSTPVPVPASLLPHAKKDEEEEVEED